MIENPTAAARNLLHQIHGSGRMSSVTYDTAWVARLHEIDDALSHRALEWICEHQLADGSWGAEIPYYYHDRLISTLSAMLALGRAPLNGTNHRFEDGRAALVDIAAQAASALDGGLSGATVGFELIIPPLVAEAESLGLIDDQSDCILGHLAAARQRKLKLLAGRRVDRFFTAAFSAELAGTDGQDRLDIENLKEDNGSVGHSPAATAYYLLRINPQDESALAYLNQIANPDGGIPDLIPFEVFQIAWTLWNLQLAGDWPADVLQSMQPHLDHLRFCWKPGQGIGLSAGYSIPDGDDTAIVFTVLTNAGLEVDLASVLSFKGEDHFRTYHLEADTSNSVASHALFALRAAGRQPDDASVRKAIDHLQARRTDGFWCDKWNLSPYYTTSHVIIACAGFADELVAPSVRWMLASRYDDGSWGQHVRTAEETAYCLQALCIWVRHHGPSAIPAGMIAHSASWLAGHAADPPPPLWIGKGLYCPELVVRSAIVSALKMAQEVST